MSKSHKTRIICPNCQTPGEFEIWDSINANLDPELREKLFSEDIFIYECPQCGHKTGIPYDTIYHDMQHKFMIFFSFFKADDFSYEPLDLSDIPMLMKDYTYRHVNGLWELKEKILILEKGLNDVAIERMKYGVCHYECPELAERGIKLFFGDVRYDIPEYPDGIIIFFYDDEDNKSKKHFYPMACYYEQCLACELDPRMAVKSCETVDEGWISMKLKSANV